MFRPVADRKIPIPRPSTTLLKRRKTLLPSYAAHEEPQPRSCRRIPDGTTNLGWYRRSLHRSNSHLARSRRSASRHIRIDRHHRGRWSSKRQSLRPIHSGTCSSTYAVVSFICTSKLQSIDLLTAGGFGGFLMSS